MVSKDVKFSGSKEVIDKHTNVSWAAIHTSQAPEIKKKGETVQLKVLHGTCLPWSNIVLR